MRFAPTIPILAMAGSLMSSGRDVTAAEFRLPPTSHRTLENGIRLHVMEFRTLPLVNFHVVVGAGSSVDPEGRAGLADLVADLLRKGTTSRTATQIAEETDTLGALLDTGTDLDASHISSEFLAADAATGLALLHDLIAHPAFSTEEIERLRGEKLGELQAIREDPSALAGRRFMQILYGAHPYGHPVSGWESTISAITREDITGFFARYYVPSNIIVVAAGDFDAKEMMESLSRTFDTLPAAGKAAGPASDAAPVAQAARGIHLIDKPESTQSQVRIGAIGIDRKDPDYIPLMVANTIFGGGFTSRLMEEIRVNRGLSYGVRSRFVATLMDGPYVISTFTKNDTTLEIIQVALAELERFRRDGATAEELERAKSYLKGTFAIGHQSADAMADMMADIAFYALPRDYYDGYLDRLMSVTREDVARVARRFPFDGLQIMVLGEAKAIRAPLATLGTVQDAPLDTDTPRR